ncbi:MAG TPA: helix-turn-helix domain-containing protein [Candidatus Agathobaculum merdipullorum]|nr:helix-turn-helix domain-containing protein [Candidatus Agathobaculum merdipullorum]
MKTIKRYREARGIKQTELAAHFGIAQSTVVKWESDGKYPPCQVMPELAAFLGCTTDELYAHKPEKEAI